MLQGGEETLGLFPEPLSLHTTPVAGTGTWLSTELNCAFSSIRCTPLLCYLLSVAISVLEMES